MVEGYCDYVANETSYPFQAGVTRVLANHPTFDASFRYFQYYAAVRYLIEMEKKNFVDIVEHAENYDYQDLAVRFARKTRADDNNPPSRLLGSPQYSTVCTTCSALVSANRT